MIQNVPGKWSWLQGLGQTLGTFAQERERRQDKTRGRQENQADTLFKLAQQGALPDTLDGNAVTALQGAGVQPDALYSISKQAKARQQRDVEESTRRNALLDAQMQETKAQALERQAHATKLGQVEAPQVNEVNAARAADPFARANVPFAEALAEMKGLPSFQGVSDRTIKVYYDAAKAKIADERAAEQRRSREEARRGSGGGGPREMTPTTQLNYWQDLAKEAVSAARGMNANNPGLASQTPAQQEDALLHQAMGFVQASSNPAIAAQLSKGMGVEHFRAALAATRPKPKKEESGPDAIIRGLQGQGGATPAPGGPARAATAADVRAAIQALGTDDEAKIRAWLTQHGITPPKG